MPSFSNDLPASLQTRAILTLGETSTSQLETKGDADWFKVTLHAGERYQISLEGHGADALPDSHLRLLNAAGQEIASDDDSGAGFDALIVEEITETGTYYIEASSFGGYYDGGYALRVDEKGPDSPLEAIDWGTKLSGRVVDVYFAAAGERFDGKTSQGWTNYEISQAMAAMDRIADVADLTFRRTQDPSRAEFKLVTNDGISGFGYMHPDDSHGERGVGVFNTAAPGWDRAGGLEAGGHGFLGLMHEFSHGLGLAHPHDGGGISSVLRGVNGSTGIGAHDLNQGIYTIMSYNSGWLSELGSAPLGYGNAATPMALDIAVLQAKYGANETHRGGNDLYTLDGSAGRGAAFAALWDTGGLDEIRYGGNADATIDLRAATLGYEAGGGGFISHVEGAAGGLTIAAGVTIERATGGNGADAITGNAADNVLNGRGGADEINGGAGIDRLLGGNGNDLLRGEAGRDRLYGEAGADALFGGAGNDLLDGGAGGDRLDGGDGLDRVSYLSAQNGVRVDLAQTSLNRGDAAGDSYLSIEVLIGSRHDDNLNGDADNNRLIGHRGADRLTGRDGADMLSGRDGEDRLFGDNGRDRIDGGIGDDFLSGGTGADTFMFRNGDGADVVTDFTVNEDRLHLSAIGTDFDALTITERGDNTLIDYGTGSIVLLGVEASDLDAHDFLF